MMLSGIIWLCSQSAAARFIPMSHAAVAASPFTGEKEFIIGEETRRTDDLVYTWDDDDDGTMRVYSVKPRKEEEDDDNECDDEDEESLKGVLVGRLITVRERVDDAEEVWLADVQVAPHMQRRGIGLTLVEITMEFDLSHIPAVEQHDSYQYSLTLPGQRLVARGIESGLIPIDLCYFSSAHREHRPWSSALLKPGEQHVDPLLDSAIILQAIANRKAGVVTPSKAGPQ